MVSSSAPSHSGPSQRQLRAGELLRHALADVLLRGETGDPELERPGVSIHEVKMSPDLKIATCFIATLTKGREEAAVSALNRNKKLLRGLLAPRLDMKFMPDLRFKIDTALDYASRIEALLHSPAVARDLTPKE